MSDVTLGILLAFAWAIVGIANWGWQKVDWDLLPWYVLLGPLWPLVYGWPEQ